MIQNRPHLLHRNFSSYLLSYILHPLSHVVLFVLILYHIFCVLSRCTIFDYLQCLFLAILSIVFCYCGKLIFHSDRKILYFFNVFWKKSHMSIKYSSYFFSACRATEGFTSNIFFRNILVKHLINTRTPTKNAYTFSFAVRIKNRREGDVSLR